MQNNYTVDIKIESDKITDVYYDALTTGFYFVNRDLNEFLPKDMFVTHDNFFKLYLPIDKRQAKKGKNEDKVELNKQTYIVEKLEKVDPETFSEVKKSKIETHEKVEGEELWKVSYITSRSKYFTKNIPASIFWEVLLTFYVNDLKVLFAKGDYAEKTVLDIGAFSKMVYLISNSFSYDAYFRADVFGEHSEEMLKYHNDYKKALFDHVFASVSVLASITENNKTEVTEKFVVFYYATLAYIAPFKHITEDTINYKMYLSVLCGQYLSNKHELKHLEFGKFIGAVNEVVETLVSNINNEKKEKKEKKAATVKKMPPKKLPAKAPVKKNPTKKAPVKVIPPKEEKEDFDLNIETQDDMII